ncbi:MAG: ABC transporter permease [Syntrophomonadaceae bacterium]|nr:ABC transporter permease [Syntrophomonadaceae bacterium]
MIFGDGIRLVSNNLRRRKGRTFLTALGVAIGTASIIAMISLAVGLNNVATASVDSWNDLTTLDVYTAWDQNTGQMKDPLTAATVTELQQIPGVSGVLAMVNYYGGGGLTMGRMTGWASSVGVDLDTVDAYPFTMAEGRFLKGKGEAVVTWRVPENMFEKKRPSRNNQNNYNQYTEPVRTDMLNKTITITAQRWNSDTEEQETKDYKFKVVGVLTEGFSQYESSVYLPEEAVREMRKWSGDDNQGGRERADTTNYDNIKVKVSSRDDVENVVAGIREAGYETWSPTEMLEEINQLFLIIEIILAGIGAISLLVASIGIMNTMFMSILERTREIGIMKVLGANLADIRRLFLMESGFIGMIGGVAGLLVAWGTVAIVNVVAINIIPDLAGMNITKVAIIPLWLALSALSFAVFIGVVSGLLPAQRASRISPLQAIRQD